MGGYGSGRQNGRPLAEEALFIDIAFMLRTRLAISGNCISDTLSWTCNGEQYGSINYTCDMSDLENASLELRYSVREPSTAAKHDRTQAIMLSYSIPNFGGHRWWMHCPVNGSRVGKLYCPKGGYEFASRTAWRLGYRSQRESDQQRPFSRLNKLQRKFGCEEGYEIPLRRPKGMWDRTYQRHLRKFEGIERECDMRMSEMMEKLTSFGERVMR